MSNKKRFEALTKEIVKSIPKNTQGAVVFAIAGEKSEDEVIMEVRIGVYGINKLMLLEYPNLVSGSWSEWLENQREKAIAEKDGQETSD